MRRDFTSSRTPAILLPILILAGFLLVPSAVLADDAYQPNGIDYAMYVNADVRDAEGCAMTVENTPNGKRGFVDRKFTNPAMSCQDTFAWKIFTDAILDEFWKNYATDLSMWPQTGCQGGPHKKGWGPIPLCGSSAAEPGEPCCTPPSGDSQKYLNNPGYSNDANRAISCPFYPGDHGGEPTGNACPGKRQSKAHSSSFIDTYDPGRKIRQEVAEVVYRNKAFFDYVFDNDLYNSEGLSAAFGNAKTAMVGQAPYRSHPATANLTRIEFPVDAVMLKTNWISDKRLKQLLRDGTIPSKYGKGNVPANPYISMMIRGVDDNHDAILEPGLHHLVAMHVSSKDIPNWIWATFEHMDNPGRCDFIGCNDAYGFASPDTLPSKTSFDNYTVPKTTSDGLPQPGTIFDLGHTYDGGAIRPNLDSLLNGLGIGTAPSSSDTPSPADAAWRNYRLKGSQTEFTTSEGRNIHLGNSVLEGGFMTSASCITCHARAAIGPEGSPANSAMNVFVSETGFEGYLKSANGVPNPYWYRQDSLAGNQPILEALQFDFVWGVLFAKPLQKQ